MRIIMKRVLMKMRSVKGIVPERIVMKMRMIWTTDEDNSDEDDVMGMRLML